MLKYCIDRYKTQKVCDEAVDYYLLVLTFIPDWFVTSKILETFHDALLANNDILFSDDQMCIVGVDLDKINLDNDNNFDEDDPETIIYLRLLAWCYKFEKRKALKKDINIELMPVAWHRTRWWDCCISEDEKK